MCLSVCEYELVCSNKTERVLTLVFPCREWYSSEVYVLRHLDGLNTHCLHSQQPHTLCVSVTPCRHQVFHQHTQLLLVFMDILYTPVFQSHKKTSDSTELIYFNNFFLPCYFKKILNNIPHNLFWPVLLEKCSFEHCFPHGSLTNLFLWNPNFHIYLCHTNALTAWLLLPAFLFSFCITLYSWFNMLCYPVSCYLKSHFT